MTSKETPDMKKDMMLEDFLPKYEMRKTGRMYPGASKSPLRTIYR